jgi:hypothetical protein
MFVDPAGLQMIQSLGPRAAGGASGAIYTLLNIAAFPASVRRALCKVGDAYWHTYKVNRDIGTNVYQCCHAIGPNFGSISSPTQTPISETAALEALVHVYTNILRQFIRSRLPKLRLLPISSGIFAGPFRNTMASMAFMAISHAILRLNKSEIARLHKVIKNNNSAIEMCIYETSELNTYKKAFVKIRSHEVLV